VPDEADKDPEEPSDALSEESARDAAAAGPRNERPSDEESRRLGASGAAAPEARPSNMSGIELAREALAQAKADARKRGSVPGSQRRRTPRPIRDRGRGGDPRAFGAAIHDLLADRGWEQRAAVGGVFGNWRHIVGPELAEHTVPERFEDGELVITADSTAWATQLRLLASTLVRRLNEELGDGTVRRVKVIGPASAPRRRGAWRVR
jgi:predicted nucleic acid-binding Zn ribbon protein